jgi:hypothetical protein
VLRSTSETALQAVANTGAVDPTYRAKAQVIVGKWLASTAAGRTVTVPGVNDVPLAANKSNLAALSQQLISGSAATRPDMATPATAGARPAIAKPLDVSANNPNTYPVRGGPGSGNLYWTNMQVAYEADYCSGGSCTDEDKITSNVTIDPGATSTRITSSSTYSPNHGNFANKHLEGWAINHGYLVGNANSGNLPGAGPFYVGNSPYMYGAVLTSAVTLWVSFQGVYHSGDGAKTHDATCESQNIGSACRY